MVTIREDGRQRRVTAAEAFILQLTKKGLAGDSAAARSSLGAIEAARARRSASGHCLLPVRVQIRLFGLCSSIVDLGLGSILNPHDEERARLLLKPWIVEAALSRLGSREKEFARLLIRPAIFWAERRIDLALGCEVTSVDPVARVLRQSGGEEIGYGKLIWATGGEPRRLTCAGVDLRLGVQIECILEADGRVSGVRLASGEELGADIVIVGIGIVPAVAPLLEAGAAGTNGLDVDEYCRTSLPDVFAIGDCAAQVSPFAAGARIRIESVQNASDQAGAVAKTIAGSPTVFRATPWFWSNQYDLKLQTVGISLPGDVAVLRGDPATGSFAVAYLRDGGLAALDCVNATRDYVQGRKLIEQKRSVSADDVADMSVPLKKLSELP